jgi:GNAT superfamily N-acetyltransferase
VYKRRLGTDLPLAPRPRRLPHPERVIRDATAADLEHLLDVQERANAAGLSPIFTAEHPLPTSKIRERWRRAFVSGLNRFRVYEDGGRIVGVCIVDAPWLHALQVLPERWGTGVAAALQEDAVRWIRDAGEEDALLRVLAANARARRFWEKHGWELLPGSTTPFQDPPHPDVVTYSRPL